MSILHSERLAAWQARAPKAFPPSWASAWGDDAYGLWADVHAKEGDGTARQRMRWLEPGSFLMGSPVNEDRRDRTEGPQHRVTLTQGLWMADTVCTQAMWRLMMGKNPSHFNEKKGGSQLHPVETVSWWTVQEFQARLQEQLPGWQASLPTEAEWEYACRAGSQTPFSFGRTIEPGLVNYDRSRPYAGGQQRGYFYGYGTKPVKALPANGWGLYQMHGNVWEWCADVPRHYMEGEQTNPGLDEAFAPELKGKNEPRAVRGGSWTDSARDARSAQRFKWQCSGAGSHLGFRFALRPVRRLSDSRVAHWGQTDWTG